MNSATILVPDKFKAWPIALLVLTVIIRYLKMDTKPVLDIKKFIICIGFFIILILSIAYSSDISYALKKLETGLSLLVFPLVFYLIAGDKALFNKKTIHTVKLTFIISLVFFLISTFTYFFFTEPFFTFKDTLEHYTNLVDIRISEYSIHSIYLSIYIGVAIIFSFSLFKGKNESDNMNIIIYFILLILIVFMAILNKKGPIISLGILGVFLVIKNKFSYQRFIFISLTVMALVGLIVVLPRFNDENKFRELLEIGENRGSSTGLRLQIYECALQQIVKSPIVGHGWGDIKNVLNDCYLNDNRKLLLESNYNSHNQYLSILLSIGVLGFSAFLYYLFYIFKISKKEDSQILFFLILYFCLNMLTENILEREDGVILFAFFVNLFTFENSKTQIR
ncbi:O-antigen ligase family protein [Winogradskyella pulchriflava]|uniref:O-antigen ligase family protein n=1 Tax=Winogradskyella pulchriflava TaxID=1110688 RepID=A0ABV6Q597_9FLAO